MTVGEPGPGGRRYGGRTAEERREARRNALLDAAFDLKRDFVMGRPTDLLRYKTLFMIMEVAEAIAAHRTGGQGHEGDQAQAVLGRRGDRQADRLTPEGVSSLRP